MDSLSIRKYYFILQGLIVFTVLYVVWTNLASFFSIFDIYRNQKVDDVVRWENDISPLKQDIPPEIKETGYISDWDRFGYNKDVYIEYTLTVYALSPRFVHRGLNYEWVIANSTEDDFLEWLIPQLSFPHSIKNYGKGIYLIHQEIK